MISCDGARQLTVLRPCGDGGTCGLGGGVIEDPHFYTRSLGDEFAASTGLDIGEQRLYAFSECLSMDLWLLRSRDQDAQSGDVPKQSLIKPDVPHYYSI